MQIRDDLDPKLYRTAKKKSFCIVVLSAGTIFGKEFYYFPKISTFFPVFFTRGYDYKIIHLILKPTFSETLALATSALTFF